MGRVMVEISSLSMMAARVMPRVMAMMCVKKNMNVKKRKCTKSAVNPTCHTIYRWHVMAMMCVKKNMNAKKRKCTKAAVNPTCHTIYVF
jgi:hypothetical protein